jgi:hypothetical protein
VLPEAARTFLQEIFHRAPTDMRGPYPREAKALQAFHHDLIASHLERDLRSERVLRDVARGTEP